MKVVLLFVALFAVAFANDEEVCFNCSTGFNSLLLANKACIELCQTFGSKANLEPICRRKHGLRYSIRPLQLG